MKSIFYSIISIPLLFLGSACKKDVKEYKSTANVIAINAAIGAGSVKINVGSTSGFYYAKAPDLAFGASSVNGAYTGSNMLTVVSSTDTTKTLFTNQINLEPINTLYISGQSPTIDTMLRAEKDFPYVQYANINPDYSMYVRFVNLSPNSTPLNINIKAAATNEVTAMSYKGISVFKKYAALTTTADYIFEVRDAATNAILTTYTLSVANNRYKTVTLVIKGLVGTTTGANAFGIFPVVYN